MATKEGGITAVHEVADARKRTVGHAGRALDGL